MAVFRVPVEIEYSDAGSKGVNIFHVRTADEFPASEGLQGAVNSIHQFYEVLAGAAPSTGPIHASGTSFNLGNVVEVDSDRYAYPTWSLISVSHSTDDLPPANQICVTWKTSTAARRATGRTFLGPLHRTTVEGQGAIAPGVRANVLAAAQGLVARNLADNGWAVGVWGLENPGGTNKVIRDITGARVGTKFAVLTARRD